MEYCDGSVTPTKRIRSVKYNKRDFANGILSKYLDRLGLVRIKRTCLRV